MSTSASAEQLVEFGVLGDAGEVHDFAAGAEISLDGPPIARPALRVRLANGRHLHAANFLVGQVMGHAHETDADKADANSFC